MCCVITLFKTTMDLSHAAHFSEDIAPCLYARTRKIEDGAESNNYIEKCDRKGRYEPMQCDVTKSRCWCVDSEGKMKAGTEMFTDEGKPNCGELSAQHRLHDERRKNRKFYSVCIFALECHKRSAGARRRLLWAMRLLSQ